MELWTKEHTITTLPALVAKIFYVLCVTVMDVLFTIGAYRAYRGLRKLVTGKQATPV